MWEYVVVKCVYGERIGGSDTCIYAVTAHISENNLSLLTPSSLLSSSSSFPPSSLPPSSLPGIDVEEVKGVEEAAMLEDAQRLKNDSSLKPPISVGGATLLHIAAAKNYLRVLK